MKSERHFGVASIVGIVAAIVSLIGALHFDSSAEILTAALSSQANSNITRTFTVPLKTRYTIEARCRRRLPPVELRQFLHGGNIVEVALTKDRQNVKLNYLAAPTFDPGVDSTDQLGNLVFDKKWIGQDIAYFDGEPGTHYTITATTVRSNERLKLTKPVLVVYFEPLEDLTSGFVGLFFYVIAFAFGSFGIAVGGLYLRSRVKSKRAKSSISSQKSSEQHG